ncbi:hypothetical protein [Afifella pfennigii]|uniref:hypothetical protein n=1 Tax=Afifella pfennigii TaxID=209897 RepID=UPI00047D96CC|nr:hypothetical protein [Afifella pfennigii]
MIKYFLKAILASAMMAAGTAPSLADSCWDHNGSLLRLKASGNQRWLYYERPRATLRQAGVGPGTLLFDGRKVGNRYEGNIRRFSRFCPGEPLVYWVEGPVRSDQLQVTLFGSYEVHERCQPTGSMASDRLVFTYSHQC